MLNQWKGNNKLFKTYVEGNSKGDGKSPASGKESKGKIKYYLLKKRPNALVSGRF